jgi:hypothetical protein
MAAESVHATGADVQGELRKRNVAAGQNGSYIPQDLRENFDEKTKEKVRTLQQTDGNYLWTAY